MSPIQQMFLGIGAASEKTYVDNVFSTFLYKGNNNSNPDTQSINNGIDLGTEGGLVWIKSRTNTYNHILQDSVNGTGKWLQPNTNGGTTNTSQYITSFNANGFSLGTDNDINNSSQDFSSWTFRKAPGFCDVVSYSGSGNVQSISHSLGSVPGMILIKRTDDAADWYVWHRYDSGKYLKLNSNTSAATNSGNQFFGTTFNSTHFSVGHDSHVNGSGNSYVAYVFAGGESTAATARSVDFDGSDDWMNTPATSDFAFGTGDFTIECWINSDNKSNNAGFFNIDTGTGIGGTDSIAAAHNGTNWLVYAGSAGQINAATSYKMNENEWYHVAYVRQSNTVKLYVNGTEVLSGTDSTDYSTNQALAVGSYADSTNYSFNGKISNLRIVKGTAVYTSAFKPPTEPLTNITNTKMLCCNNSSVTGKTVGPGLTAWGTVTAKTDSPFDDPAGFKFGESGSESVIKCGSYVGNANDVGPEVFLGFEPQFLMVKNSNAAQSWHIMDCMRGIVTRTGASNSGNGNENKLYADWNGAETDSNESISLTATGFKVVNSNSDMNGNGNTMIYIAIRRSDGYVGKPPELGTGVFAMDTGNGSTTIPAYDSGFPVDFALDRRPGASEDWYTSARLMGAKWLKTNANSAETSGASYLWDSNVGYVEGNWADSDYQSWMWKRHAGMDVVTYKGNSVSGTQIPHSCNAVPQMIWVKRRDSNKDWQVGHYGANGGSSPWNYYLELNRSQAEASQVGIWNNTAPTSTHFTVGNWTQVNNSSGEYIAMLFASVSGISKVGSYTGNATDSDHSSGTNTITFGFQPRMVIIKTADASGREWVIFDTLRGWASGSGNTKRLRLNLTNAQNNENFGYPTSTGMVLTGNGSSLTNNNGDNYIYYAHA
jgi:hypothetical protein